MDIQSEISKVETDIVGVAKEVESIFLTANKEALVILPIVARGLGAAAAVMSLVCPQAAGAAAVMATAATMVSYADETIVTADGIIMHPNEAKIVGAAIVRPTTNEEKAAFAVKETKMRHPEMKPELADNAAHIAVQAAVAQLHHVEPAAAK